MQHMTKKEVVTAFREYVLPGVRQLYEQDGKVDAIARRTAFGDYTDSLAKDGQISWHQYNNWTNPV